MRLRLPKYENMQIYYLMKLVFYCVYALVDIICIYDGLDRHDIVEFVTGVILFSIASHGVAQSFDDYLEERND